MILSFHHIKPTSFACRVTPETIWDKEIQFDSDKVYQIIAASGSGKTTLVSILSGIRGDYDGYVVYHQHKFSDYTMKDWSRWRSHIASFVYQDLRLFPELTAMDNIRISFELSGQSTTNDELIFEYAHKLGIVKEKLFTPVKFLSLGQSQRIAIIRALCKNYKWLILDEPFSHLDAENAQLAWNLIKNDASAKKAGIIITCLDPYLFINAANTYHL